MPEKPISLIDAFRSFASQQGWSIVAEKQISSGCQLLVSHEKRRASVSFYTTGNILIQGKDGPLRDALLDWKSQILQGNAQHPIQISPSTPGHERVPDENAIARFHLAKSDWERVQTLLLTLDGEHHTQSENLDDTHVWRLSLRDANTRVKATLYTTGTLLVQGKVSMLFETVCQTIETLGSTTFAQRGARFVSGAQQAIVEAHLSQPSSEDLSRHYAAQQLGQALLAFLAPSDRNTYLAAVGVLQAVQSTGLTLLDFSLLVMPFARVYEGFLLQMAQRLDPAPFGKLAANKRRANAGIALDVIVRCFERGANPQTPHAIKLLKDTWRNIRNTVMHAQKGNTYRDMQTALRDIDAIHQAMKQTYACTVQSGLVRENHKGSASLPQRAPALPSPEAARELSDEMPGNERALASLAEQETRREKSSSEQTPLALSHAAHIGTDEAGKGDYFGPLVIAGVYVDEAAMSQLLALGVRDSKLISDETILVLAEKIKSVCHGGGLVLPLAPERYNRLYQQHNNLNHLLAFGHAHVLARIHERTGCCLALVDQFGDATLVPQELQKRGCQLTLLQRPRAEDDVAVAAASILARAEFVQQLASLSKQIGINLPKGSSNPKMISVGREIIKRAGPEGLARVAKLHFKVTREIQDHNL